jgi:thiamine pyrophosphate-dependent acetolactate synthase large subunit-like protein
MNEMSGAKALVRMLQLFGVERIFGLSGDTSLPFYDALYRLVTASPIFRRATSARLSASPEPGLSQ